MLDWLNGTRDNWEPWLIFAAYLVGTWLVAFLAKRLLKGVVSRLAAKSSGTLDDRLLQAGTPPVRLIIWSVGLNMAITALGERLAAIGAAPEYTWATKGVQALVVLAVTGLLSALLRAGLDWYLHEVAVGNEATWDEQLLPTIRRTLSVVLYFIAGAMILDKWGIDITALVTTAGVASLAVALAAQETLSNMLGGLIILVDRPFRVGDVIELTDGRMGTVNDIGLRSTHIRMFDGNALVVPNKDMANSRIINYALPNQEAAVRATIGVSYSTDIEMAKRVLKETLGAHPEVLQEPEPGVWFTKFGESTLDLFFSCWVQSYKDRFRVSDELNVMILKAFRAHNIEIAFPQRDLHVFMQPTGNEPGKGES